MMQPDDPPFLTVGTEVSAKYKGAFCEAKVNKVVKVVKVKVTFKYGLGSAVLFDDAIKGVLKVGAQVKALHPDKNQHLDGIVNKIQDCSQYTVVFDDGDITTLRRSSLCLKSGRHFAEGETLDQLPLTHPEHFGTPVVGGRRGRRSRHHPDSEDGTSEEEYNMHKRHRSRREEWESDIGKVVCVEIGDKKKQKDNWFPGLVVAPTAQDSVKIETKKDYLVRSFQDGRYYTVPKKEATSFSREIGCKVTQSSLRTAVDKALLYIDRDELPPHWDRDLLFGVDMSDLDLDKDSDSDTSDDEPREEKDHFVAQLYKFMEECGTPINKGPTIGTRDLDLYKLFKVVQKLGGFNRVMNQNQWKIVSVKMCPNTLGFQSASLVKAAYKKYLQSFEDFYRKLGCTMVSSPRGSRTRHRSGRSLIRDCDKRPTKRKGGETDSAEEETDRKEDDTEEEEMKKEIRPKEEPEEEKKEERREEKKEERREEKKEEWREEKKEERREEKKEEKKKEEPVLRTSTPPVTPVRTMSPTTRERAKELKVPRPEMKLRLLSKGPQKESPKESQKEMPRVEEPRPKKSAEEPIVKKKETKEDASSSSSSSFSSSSSSSSSSVSSSSSTSIGMRKSRADEAKRKESKDEEPKTRSSCALKEEKKIETESEDEAEEKTQTRSLRNREEREKEAEAPKKIFDKKQLRPDHQRSASCNSTSSGTSSSSSTSCTSNMTENKANGKGKGKILKTQTSIDDARKRGRKKRSESIEGEIAIGKSLLPSHVPICIGDKLRVLYGPNNKESKVTYEAKVLEVEESATQRMYYVHYLGWNTRYDEWVVRQRVAQNLSWCQARTKKGRAASKESEKEKGEKKEEKREKEVPSRPTPAKRGRPHLATRRESERSDSASSTRASTRSEKSSQPHSHSASPSERTERRRSKRNLNLSREKEEDTEESDSEDYESGLEIGGEEERVRRASESQVQSSISSSPGNLTPEPSSLPFLQEIKKEVEPVLDPVVKSEPVAVVQPSISEAPQGSCGKDIDLKAIESEMKGLDKPLKKDETPILKEVAGRILTTVIPGSLTITEKKKHDPRKPFDSPVKRVEIPVRLVPAQEIMGQIKPVPITGMKKEPLLEEDIYEFREPEPFEFSDIRSRKDGKNRGPGGGTPEDAEPEAKVKKKGRPKKEGEDKSESESESPVTPQKKPAAPAIPRDLKETSPFKRLETKDQPGGVKKEFKDYTRRPEAMKTTPEDKAIKEEPKEPLRIVSPPCLQIKEAPPSEVTEKPLFIDFFSKDKMVQRMSLDLKFDLSDSKESHFIGSSVVITPKKLPLKKEGLPTIEGITPVKNESPEVTLPSRALKIEVKDDPNPLKDPPKIGALPTQGKVKPIAVMIDRSSSSSQVLTRIPGPSGHVMAQVVMPQVESRVLAKPLVKPSIEAEKSFTIGPATSLQGTSGLKQDDRPDGKLMPFSQRQQHIFPHLLNRPEPVEEKSHELTIQRAPALSSIPISTPPVTTSQILPSVSPPEVSKPPSSIPTPPKAVPLSDVEKSNIDKSKCESTVEESIEAVVLRARQDQMHTEEERKDPKSVSDKRRRNPGRSKKTISREFLPDTSEDSDSDTRCEKGEHRQKRLKSTEGNKYSPAKKVPRPSVDIDKKAARRCEEEDRGNDADEEDNEGNFLPLKPIPKEAVRRRKESEGETDKDSGEKEVRPLKKKRLIPASSKRPEDNEESGLGDLLCEETIPPGSPMPQDNPSADPEIPTTTAVVKQEMPFASVPTGSSFSKRGSAPPSSLQTNLQMSLQQLHPSVCIQSVNKTPTTASQSFGSSPPPTIQPNVTITSLNPNIQPPSLPISKVSSLSFRGPSVLPPSVSATIRPPLARPSPEVTPKPVVSCPNVYIPEVVTSKPSSIPSSSLVLVPVEPAVSVKVEEPKVPASRPGPLPSIDNTPPTTPESTVSNLSDSPQRENESSKMDENSKNVGQYSSEMDIDTKLDNYSEDSNTMDSNTSISKCQVPKRPSSVSSRGGPCHQSHSEGWDTEDGSANLAPPKRRKRGSKTKGHAGEDDKGGSHSTPHGTSSSRRRRRHSSSKGSAKGDDETEAAHGLNTLSIVACNSTRGKSRYNFCQELDPDLDAGKRIVILQNRMQELKRTYMQVKAELASVERRRKKLRKKEREKEALTEGN